MSLPMPRHDASIPDHVLRPLLIVVEDALPQPVGKLMRIEAATGVVREVPSCHDPAAFARIALMVRRTCSVTSISDAAIRDLTPVRCGGVDLAQQP